jgi:protein-S-isoprenylcysteine O-methyltransferase Ste14
MRTLDLIAFCNMAIFGISEWVLIFTKKKEGISSVKKDRTTISFILTLTINVAIAITLSFYLNGIGVLRIVFSHKILMVLTICFVIIGMMIRWFSIITLSKYFSTNLTIVDGHTLYKDGLYKYIRHPSYLGATISFVSVGLYFSNLISFCIIVSSIVIGYIHRIRNEEKMLINHFGKEYVDYQNKTKMLVPFIW